MKRREFLAASALTGLASYGSLASAAESRVKSGKEYYELRVYKFKDAAQQGKFLAFLKDAAIPAVNRLGVKPVGVFKMKDGENLDLFVLLPHATVESAVTLTARLGADDEFLAAGAAVINAPKSAPAYERVESSLMLAFDNIPKLETPAKGPERVFQLRTYEAHSIERGQKKIDMFNEGGEIAIFRDTGMPPVFFGETLIGDKMPNLTYMLGFNDMAALEAGWKKFLAAPAWNRIKKDPQYKDTVSNITNLLLVPAACSQI